MDGAANTRSASELIFAILFLQCMIYNIKSYRRFLVTVNGIKAEWQQNISWTVTGFRTFLTRVCRAIFAYLVQVSRNNGVELAYCKYLVDVYNISFQLVAAVQSHVMSWWPFATIRHEWDVTGWHNSVRWWRLLRVTHVREWLRRSPRRSDSVDWTKLPRCVRNGRQCDVCCPIR